MGAWLRAIGVTLISLLLFGFISSGYQLTTAYLTDDMDGARLTIALQDALVVTIMVFGPWLYFLFQTIVLAVGRLQRLFLFAIPMFLLVAANGALFYNSFFAPPGYDFGIVDYLPYTVPAFIFVLLNNVLVVRPR